MKEKLPIFLMLIGIPGSGKSFWVKNNVKNRDFVVVSSDATRKQLTGNVSDLSRDEEMWELVKERVVENLSQGKNVLLDATNVNGFYRRQFIDGLPPCKLQAKRFSIDLEEAKQRVKKDIEQKRDRSHVPMPVIERMFEQYRNFCRPKDLEKEGFEVIEKI